MVLLHHVRRGFDLDHLFSNNPTVISWIYFKSLTLFHIDLTWFYEDVQKSIYKIKGVLGVQIFFIISGFLITRGLLNQDASFKIIRKFYFRRFLRIYPAYILMIFVSLVVLGLNVSIDARQMLMDFIKYACFMQNYLGRNFLLEHTWTMVVFEHFYLVIPLIVYVVFKCFKSRERRWKVLLVVFLLMKVVGPFIRNYYLLHGFQFIVWPLRAPAPYFTTLFHIGSFSTGGLLALLEVYGSKYKKSIWVGVPFWVLGIVLYWILFFSLDWNYNYGSWYLYSLGSVACVCMMIAAYHGVSLLTHLKFLQWIGRYSYGIYLWHILVFMFWIRFSHIIPLSALLILYFLSTVLAGYISNKTIERYFLKLFKE